MRFISWTLLLLIVYACDLGRVTNVPKPSVEEPKAVEPITPGDPLSEPQVPSMVEGEMEGRFPPELDTAAILQRLLLNKGPISWSQRLDSTFLAMAIASPNPVPEELALAMEVSDYVGYWGGGKHWQGFLFLNREQDAHFGPSVVLLILNEESLDWSKMILAQHYGREGYEYQQWAEPMGTDSVRLVRDKRWAADSTARQETIYQILPDGNRELIRE
ncbi:MAG: hypothetical protein AAGH79_09955 [Bacteroidota bacterium]